MEQNSNTFCTWRSKTRKWSIDQRIWTHVMFYFLSPNGWMSKSLTLKYVEWHYGKFFFSRRSLAWDSFDSHTTNSVEKTLTDCKVDSLVIPGGCTKYVQALDVSWNKLFKTMMKELYDNWLSQGIQEYTISWNLKAPPIKPMVELVLESWASFSLVVIKKSLKFVDWILLLMEVRII